MLGVNCTCGFQVKELGVLGVNCSCGFQVKELGVLGVNCTCGFQVKELGMLGVNCTCGFQVKELGMLGVNCTCLGSDISKLFSVYWDLGKPNATIPKHWPADYRTNYNSVTPMRTKINGSDAHIYLSVSNPIFIS